MTPYFTNSEIVALVAGTSFAAGLNVYATVATLGILSRTGVVPLPSSLHLLDSNVVIAASLLLFAVEFFADKIPVFDLVWNALHTFVRVPLAALLAYEATGQLSPGMKLFSAVLGGTIAFMAHSGKTAARAAVTPSPEPLSNISLSLGEDALTVFLSWLASTHPYAAAAVVAVFIGIIVISVRFVVRALRSLFRSAERRLVHSGNSA